LSTLTYQIKLTPYESIKSSQVQMAALQFAFTCEQVKEILGLFESPQSRVNAAILL